MTENRIIYQKNLTLLDLPENSLFMIPVSIMTKIPMKRTDDPNIHMKQILRPFSSSQVKKDWIFKHTSSGFIPFNGFGTAWQNCKLGLWLYQLWSFSNISFCAIFCKKWTFWKKDAKKELRKPAPWSGHLSQRQAKLEVVKIRIFPTGLEVHFKVQYS